ncbi:putative RNA-directed DNA polymerase [Tanacetum coccineum]
MWPGLLCFKGDYLCVLTAVYLINRLPSSVLASQSCYFLVYGRNPTLSHLRAYGCLSFATILNNKDKFNSRSEKCVFIGYSNVKKGYKLFSLESKNVIFSRDVKFYETVFPLKNKQKEGLIDTGVTTDLNHRNFFDFEQPNPKRPYDEERVPSNDDGTDSSSLNKDDDESDATSIEENAHPEGNPENLNHSDESELLENNDEEIDPYDHIDYDDVVEMVRKSSRQSKLPANLNDYVIDSKVKAMNNEMEALNRNHTWDITDLPKGRNPIRCKWIYKIKYKANGEIKRYKVRLVAKGYSQREGIDYDETFSLVVKMSTIKCLISVAVKNKWPLWQLDVNNAFLYGNLEENVYMSIPEGYRSFGCVFVVLLIYVDDIIISGNDASEIENIKTFFRSKIQIKDLGKLKYFLGIKYVGCKPVSVPMEPNTVLNFKPSEEDPPLVNITGYQKLLGKLIYLTHTKPGISYSVHYLSQHMHAPLKSHLDYAFHVLRYLKGSPGKGLRYVYNPNQSIDKMLAYSDSDWAKCPKTRIFMFGYCVFLNGCPISWKSKKQGTLSKSSTEAKYRGLVGTNVFLRVFRYLLKLTAGYEKDASWRAACVDWSLIYSPYGSCPAITQYTSPSSIKISLL